MSFFENRYKKMVADFTTEVEVRPALRVNTLKMKPSVLIARLQKKGVLLEKIPVLRSGFYYSSEFSLGAAPEYLFGYYYLQGVASQLVAEVLLPLPGETVLDMAAAPGSKTTHLAQLMKNAGTILAVDTHAQRLVALRNNCERMLAGNVLLVKKDARYVGDMGMTFDKVLLDAPCSGNFCSEEGWFGKRRLEDVKGNARVQKQLLRAAAAVLKPGGVLVYSTCSLEPEEDELIIDWFLEKHSDMRLEETGVQLGDPGITSWDGKELNASLAKTRRFWPHRTGTEGFFIAKLKKSDS